MCDLRTWSGQYRSFYHFLDGSCDEEIDLKKMNVQCWHMFTRFCYQLSFPSFVKHTTTSTSCLFWSKHVSFPNMMPILLHVRETESSNWMQSPFVSYNCAYKCQRQICELHSSKAKFLDNLLCFFFFATPSIESTNKHPNFNVYFILFKLNGFNNESTYTH